MRTERRGRSGRFFKIGCLCIPFLRNGPMGIALVYLVHTKAGVISYVLVHRGSARNTAVDGQVNREPAGQRTK